MDYYELLGVPRTADLKAIKGAHRAAVKAHHPDAGGDQFRFHQVQLAWQTLRDPEKRAFYDEHGRDKPFTGTQMDAKTIEYCYKLVIEAIQDPQLDIERMDVAGYCVAKLDDAVTGVTLNLAEGDSMVAKLDKMEARMGRSGPPAEDDIDPVGLAIARRRAEIELKMVAAREERDALVKTRVIFRSMIYAFDANPPPDQMHAIFARMSIGGASSTNQSPFG